MNKKKPYTRINNSTKILPSITWEKFRERNQRGLEGEQWGSEDWEAYLFI